MDKMESMLPDHDPKYDIEDDKLDEANRKLASLSEKNKGRLEVVRPVEDTPIVQREKIKVGNRIIHKRTDQEYEDIWNSFIMNASEDFEQYMGYGVDEIVEIGENKFIDAYDWCDATDVMSYKTDIIHIIPCVHCRDEFSDVEQNYGLCEKCQPLYDLTYFEQVVDATSRDVAKEFLALNPEAKVVPATKTEGLAQFLYNKEFREMFLNDVLDKRDLERREIDGPSH